MTAGRREFGPAGTSKLRATAHPRADARRDQWRCRRVGACRLRPQGTCGRSLAAGAPLGHRAVEGLGLEGLQRELDHLAVMRQVLDRLRHGLDDASRLQDNLVRRGDLDRAGHGDEGAAGQAGVRHGDLRGPQGHQQVVVGIGLKDAVRRLDQAVGNTMGGSVGQALGLIQSGLNQQTGFDQAWCQRVVTIDMTDSGAGRASACPQGLTVFRCRPRPSRRAAPSARVGMPLRPCP
jgi:hypothetical protein